MKNIKKILLSIFLLLVCLVSTKAYAALERTCKYTYSSLVYGITTVNLSIYDNGSFSDSAYLDLLNSREIHKKYEVEDASKNFYSDYLNGAHKGKCPYYLYMNTWGDWEAFAYYDKAQMISDHSELNKADWGNHILISDTIAEDWIDGTYDKNAQGDDYSMQGTEWYQKDKPIKLKCLYNVTDNKIGFSSAVLTIYDDYSYTAYMLIINGEGKNTSGGPHNDFTNSLDHWSTTLDKVKSSGKCPFFMGIDTKGWNQAMAAYTKAEIAETGDYGKIGDAYIMTSRTIAQDKADYDASVDGHFIEEDEAQKQAWVGVKIPRPGDWDPSDPYGFHIADMFCSEERVIKVLKAVGNLLIIVKFALPLLVILGGTLDFSKAVFEGKSDSLSKKAKNVGIRVVIALFVFFIPTITHLMFNNLSYYNIISKDVNQCQSCLLNPNDPRYCQEWAVSADYTPTVKINISDVNVNNTTKSTVSKTSSVASTSGGGGSGTMSASETEERQKIQTLAQQTDEKLTSSNFKYLGPSTRDDTGCLEAFYYGNKCLNDEGKNAGGKQCDKNTCTKYGTDCNGFVSYLYHQAGLEADTSGGEKFRFFMHSNDGEWYATGSGKKYFKEAGTVKSTSETQDAAVTELESKAKYGDALGRTCTSEVSSCGVEHHVGIYLGNGKVIDNNGDADMIRDLKSYLQMKSSSTGCLYTNCSLQIFTFKENVFGSSGEP